MSYCRWSSMDGACDLYIYEDVNGGWTIHVAGARSSVSFSEQMKCIPTDKDDLLVWMNDLQASKTAIDLPHAGESFNLPTPGECADKVEELIALGYIVPDGVVEELREEQKELDNQP